MHTLRTSDLHRWIAFSSVGVVARGIAVHPSEHLEAEPVILLVPSRCCPRSWMRMLWTLMETEEHRPPREANGRSYRTDFSSRASLLGRVGLWASILTVVVIGWLYRHVHRRVSRRGGTDHAEVCTAAWIGDRSPVARFWPRSHSQSGEWLLRA